MTATPFMSTALKIGLPILLGTAFSASSAQAAEVIINSATCGVGNTADSTFTFGDAQVIGTLANILSTGSSGVCFNDDKKYIFNSANLANQNGTPDQPFAFFKTDQFEIKQQGLAHIFTVDPIGEVFTPADLAGINTGTYQLTYDVVLLNPPSNLEFSSYATDLSASPIAGTAISAVKTLTESTYSAVCQSANGGSCGILPDFKEVPAGVLKLSFDSKLVVSGAYVNDSTGVTFFDDIVRQRPPSSSVPGPLPIMGALSAFGFARKIRKRCKMA